MMSTGSYVNRIPDTFMLLSNLIVFIFFQHVDGLRWTQGNVATGGHKVKMNLSVNWQRNAYSEQLPIYIIGTTLATDQIKVSNG